MPSNKVIIIGPAYPFRGGLASYNERMAREYQAQGRDVTLYTFTLQYPKILFPGKTQYSSSDAPKDLKILRKINSINPFNWFKIGREIRKAKPDLVIIRYWLPFMGPCFGTILRRIKKDKSIKVLCLLDNVIPHEKRVGDKPFTKYFVKPVDGFVAMSESVLKDLSEFDTAKPRALCPHPLFDNFGQAVSRSAALASLNLPEDRKYLLFFGIIRPYKGLDLLLQAMSQPSVQELGVQLIVGGEFYSGEQESLALIEELGLGEQVHMHNRFIPNEEVANFFCGAEIICLPYKSATQSGVTQIALHFELPMLVTNVGGLPEIVPHGKAGYVVEPNPEEIAQSICDFVNNQRRTEMVTHIQELKQEFSWSRLVETFEGLYDG